MTIKTFLHFLAILLGFSGFVVLGVTVSWAAATAVFVMLWANNMSINAGKIADERKEDIMAFFGAKR